MPKPPSSLRGWVVVVFGAIGIGLLPWTVWLSASLKPHHVTHRWDLAWSGFDTGLALLFLSTAFAAYKRSPWMGALAAATGTLLVTDAWFDVVLESHADELRNAILLAVFAELPGAALCFWIAYRTERFLALVVDQALHLTAAGEGATESDLVGILEVPADGQPAREPGDANASS
jgi:4-amino-4-deoxy-L-arabinose transferase-like glycosyltransferase